MNFPLQATLAALVASVCVACTPETAAARCTGTEPEVRTRGLLTVAADLAYPPFSYDRPNDVPAGFDADLLRAIARQLELDVQMVNRGPASLTPGLIAHRHDVAAGGLRETDALRSEVCPSIPYLDADLGVLAEVGGPELSSPDDLAGGRVAVRDGGRAHAWATDELGDSTVDVLPADEDVTDAVREGRVDAGIAELPLARYAATKSRDVNVATTIDLDEHYVLAVAPDNAGLVDKLNAAIERLSSSGRLATIERKWFGE